MDGTGIPALGDGMRKTTDHSKLKIIFLLLKNNNAVVMHLYQKGKLYNKNL
jgi:hypothetical protein